MRQLLLSALLFPAAISAQGYTSYFTGNATNITTTPEFGVCMMGGATEHDNAMIWLLQKANGGDVVVLRSSGSNGYNDYLYSELGVNVNSVETLVITSVAGATNPYVLDKVANAEMIWFAGGDQYDYVSYFKNNALEDLIDSHINIKHAPIGGTSAGMAILGEHYFSAQNGSVTTAEALANPFNPYMTVGSNDFLSVPFMEDVITDTHYDYYDRRGRQATFLARLHQEGFPDAKGIACNEYVAVCIGTDGKAHVYGDYPNYQEFAYFIQPNNCDFIGGVMPEVCQPNTPLTWNYDGKAIKVYKVPGTMNGTNYFDVADWVDGDNIGGNWEDWSVQNGTLTTVPGTQIQCELATNQFEVPLPSATPNPFHDFVEISNADDASVSIYDAFGKKIFETSELHENRIDTSDFSDGLYFVRIEKDGKSTVKKLLKN
jgi:cyanophycinase-like exopeptidase